VVRAPFLLGVILAPALTALSPVPALAQAKAPAPAPTPASAAAVGEPAAAREQARLCERLNGEAGANACRAALALGIGPQRRGPLRERLARHLVALEDWDALADHLRESVELDPRDAVATRRLGLTLLLALGEPAEAVAVLQQAVGLAPEDAEARLGLAQALAATGRGAEAAAAFEAALRLDPHVLDGRPAARAAHEAARRGESWP
jgi:tetratricopeptide (TPR) repeat protein